MTYRELHDLDADVNELEIEIADCDDGALDHLIEALQDVAVNSKQGGE